MKCVILIIFLISVGISEPIRGAELQLERVIFADSDDELSGLVRHKGKLLAVADGEKNTAIYEVVELKNSRFQLKPYIQMNKLKGFKRYLKKLPKKPKGPGKYKKIDFEAIASCGETIYIANERARDVLKLTPQKLSRINLEPAKGMRAGSFNAGIEGLAVDCINQRLYVAKERSPRFIVIYDLKTLQIIKQSDISLSDRANQRVLSPKKAKLVKIDQDFSSLHFHNGFLYALERANREVTKLNPLTLQVLSRWSYVLSENGLYDSDEPYGQAESLLVAKNQIIIGIDNNKNPLSQQSEKKYNIKGPHAAILYFKKPKEF